MKKILLLTLIIINSTLLLAQREDATERIPQKFYYSNNPTPPSSAFLSKVNVAPSECVSKEEQAELWNLDQEYIQSIRKDHPQLFHRSTGGNVLFEWPTRAKTGFNDYGYYTVNFLVDHNLQYPNLLLDYNCSNRTYDWASGNHAGTDIILWPYAWKRMDEQVMEVIAAAPGVIIAKIDGNYDRNCSNNGAGSWNAIHVMHADGTVAWYLHFKTGSLTSKVVGDSVATGEYLGTAGSSGSSSWPHLHFQVLDQNGNVIDPWNGSCNNMNPGGVSRWANQQPYNVPYINRICTKGTEVDWYNCPDPEFTLEKDTFNIGDSLWLWAYTRDMENNSTMQINLFNPSNQNVINFPFTVPWATYATTYVRWYYLVDSWWVPGWWKFQIVYDGNIFEHSFYMTGQTSSVNAESLAESMVIYPNPAKDVIEISGDNNITSELTITDIQGKVMLNTLLQNNRMKLDISGYNNGVYFVELHSDKGSRIQKLVVHH